MPRLVSTVPVKTYRVTCSNCMCEVEFIPNDVVARVCSDYGGGSDTYRHIICPNPICNGKSIDIPENYQRQATTRCRCDGVNCGNR